jgi:DNA-directed RNA polymerase specialized sigma24 family protein
MTDFSALYKKYAPDVFGFALYLSGERGEAEDITSETFVRVWTSPEPIEMATVRGYLFTIARALGLSLAAKCTVRGWRSLACEIHRRKKDERHTGSHCGSVAGISLG